jgi:putative tryptophan/tyrosine transport system substrate-binding protein
VISRRRFLATAGTVVLAAPLAAEAQQAGKVFRIGFLSLREVPTSSSIYIKAFYESLLEYGWIEGKNFVLVPKSALLKSERLPELVAEMVQLKVDGIVVVGAEAALAAKHGTRTIPIVAFGVADAVAIGLVANLARPGGNVTGLSYLGTELVNKQMELLKQAVRTLSRVAVLTNPANPTHLPRSREAATAAQGLGVKVEPIEARAPSELDKAFAEMRRLQVGGVLVLTDPMFYAASSRLAQLASRSGVPAMYGFRFHVDAGGLMSYGVDLVDQYRRAATYVDKILKGAKPADLPVEQPTKFELVINLKTAKALGLTIPPSVLGRADEVIQ